MRTREPIQAISTENALKSVIPNSFKMVNDKTSNGYKYMNLLFGVELDHANEFLREIYDNVFLPTMDFGASLDVYEVYLSGIAQSQYLNVTNSGIPIKIVNNGFQGGESEFWEGDPTRTVGLGVYNLPSGVIATGHIIGVEYFRSNISGCGYFLVSTDIPQSLYGMVSGSVWRFDVNTTGGIVSYTGLWPGVLDQSYAVRGEDEILNPLGSGYLSKNYPLTRTIRDDSGVYWSIDHYEPYLGWVRDPYHGVVARIDYSGEFYYDGDGKKVYYRTAFNNPFGSGNYTTEYLRLRNIPISGTLRVYDMDLLDASGNATEIPRTGKKLYRLQSKDMLTGTGVDPQFDPIYVGYDSTVPNIPKYGRIAGSGADLYLTTSWDYQRDGSYLDEGTMTWVEGTGDITNLIKIVNPYSRYIVEYKYLAYEEAKYIGSPEASRYVSLDPYNPIYSIKTILNNEEEVPYEFTRDPAYASEKARYLTFDGWSIRPYSQISRVDFKLPISLSSGYISFQSFQQRNTYIGYSSSFVPFYNPRRVTVLDCPFDSLVVAGTCNENDLSGSGNALQWYNSGPNQLWRCMMNGTFGKTSRYIGGDCYFYKNGVNFLKENTFFSWDFRLFVPNNITLLELTEQSTNKYITVAIKDNGMLEINSNGIHIESRFRFKFNANYGLIIQTFKDPNFTNNPVFNIYVKEKDFFEKMDVFEEQVDLITVSNTYLRVMKNSTMDIDRFKIWYEDSQWQV